MPYCPNCGSYVSPGGNVCSCGTTFGYRSESEKEMESEYQKQERQTRNAVEECCRQGRKLIDSGEYLNAIEYFDKDLQIFPEYFPPTFNKARAFYYEGMYWQALEWFNKSKLPQRAIDNNVILEWIGDTLIELYELDKAIGAYCEAIDIVTEYYGRTIDFHKEQRWDSPSDLYLNSLLDEKMKDCPI